MIRNPAVADRFYPGNGTQLLQTINELTPPLHSSSKQKAIAAVSPHAGYIYSGSVAAETLSEIEIPDTVIILGVNHHGQGAPVALSTATWKMPMGEVTVDQEVASVLLEENSPIVHDELAHKFEHSLEVQVPFLQAYNPEVQIVPLVLSHISYSLCEEVGLLLARTIKAFPARRILIVASSDMSHYESRESATAKDKLALETIKNLSPEELYQVVHKNRISMCGVIPVSIALIASKFLGATESHLVRYTDSGEVSGDTNQVVGYAGFIIS